MIADNDLDLDRLPHEIRKAMDRDLVLIEGVTPGLYVEADRDLGLLKVFQADGTYLTYVPFYRLRLPSAERLRACSAAALEAPDITPTVAELLLESINTDRVIVHMPVDSDRVQVDVLVEGDAFRLFDAHRCVMVEDWPDTDGPEA